MLQVYTDFFMIKLFLYGFVITSFIIRFYLFFLLLYF